MDADVEPMQCPKGFAFFEDHCAPAQVFIKGGSFTMGRGDCFPRAKHEAQFADRRCDLEDAPHLETVGSFYIDAVETVVAMMFPYPDCPTLEAHCATKEMLRAPMFYGAAWPKALDTCQARGMRLPTEAEWEFVATAGGTRVYPWGNEPPNCERMILEECLVPNDEWPTVAAYPPSPEGIYDLAGGVAELVAPNRSYPKGYKSLPVLPADVPFQLCKGDNACYPGFELEELPGLRGGSWKFPTRARGAHRSYDLNGRDRGGTDQTGFRCVQDP